MDSGSGSENTKFREEFLEAMSDDLNTSKALAAIDEFVKIANEKIDANPKDKSLKAEISANLKLIARTLGILQIDVYEYFQFGVSEDDKKKIENLINERNEAKKLRDYARADAIREELLAMKIAVMDTPSGAIWEKL